MTTTTLTETSTMPHLVLRSLDATWNRARWEQLGDDGNRYEVIHGVLYMTTSPSSFHQWIIRQIFLTLYQQIDTPGIGTTMWSPIGLFMPGCDPVQPDLLVVRTEHRDIFQDRRIHGIPALLVEVLSPSNPETDTTIKRTAYAQAGVPEYWIVRPATRDVLLCSQPDTTASDYLHEQVCGPGSELVSPTLPIRAVVADFFANAPDTTL
jgi:Uma2 family endonuclease